MVDKKVSVLIVEDEKMLANMYATKFTMDGFIAQAANDGEAGLAVARELKPDVILLDVIMPKLDGFSVLRELRADAGLKNTPVILLTNLGQEEDIRKGKELGATDYYVKANHTPAEVVMKVKEVLKLPQ